MKALLLVAIGFIALSLVACGGKTNPISGAGAVASATATPEGTSVKSGACHYQQFLVGGTPFYEDKNVCVIYYQSSDVYWAIIPFVLTIGQYREQKCHAEKEIWDRVPEVADRFDWVPPLEPKLDRTHNDQVTTQLEGCDEGKFGGK